MTATAITVTAIHTNNNNNRRVSYVCPLTFAWRASQLDPQLASRKDVQMIGGIGALVYHLQSASNVPKR